MLDNWRALQACENHYLNPPDPEDFSESDYKEAEEALRGRNCEETNKNDEVCKGIFADELLDGNLVCLKCGKITDIFQYLQDNYDYGSSYDEDL